MGDVLEGGKWGWATSRPSPDVGLPQSSQGPKPRCHPDAMVIALEITCDRHEHRCPRAAAHERDGCSATHTPPGWFGLGWRHRRRFLGAHRTVSRTPDLAHWAVGRQHVVQPREGPATAAVRPPTHWHPAATPAHPPAPSPTLLCGVDSRPSSVLHAARTAEEAVSLLGTPLPPPEMTACRELARTAGGAWRDAPA